MRRVFFRLPATASPRCSSSGMVDRMTDREMRDSREIVTNAIDLIHEANADREPMIPPKQYKHVQAQPR